MKWEYMIVEIGVDTSSSEKRLKELGDNRWEAVSVWPLLSTIRILFKRPLKSKLAPVPRFSQI
jgi:hypothetical protein